MTPTFKCPLGLPVSHMVFSKFPLFFTAPLPCLSLLCLCPPPTSEPPGPECSGTTNPNSGYKLQTCLWHGSACSPLGEPLQQTPLSLFLGKATPTSPCPTGPLDDLNGPTLFFILIQLLSTKVPINTSSIGQFTTSFMQFNQPIVHMV